MKHFNFILIIITIALLAAIGVIFIIGTGYSYSISLANAEWTQTPLYQDYLASMNAGMIPFVVALVITLGMCIPKRLFSGRTLLAVMGGLVAASAVAALLKGDAKDGLVFLMLSAIAIQVVVLVLTLLGSRFLGYERQGFFVQVGSALLHLGIVVFLLDFMALPKSPSHIDIFWFATGCIGVGMLLCFYAPEITVRLKSREHLLTDDHDSVGTDVGV